MQAIVLQTRQAVGVWKMHMETVQYYPISYRTHGTYNYYVYRGNDISELIEHLIDDHIIYLIY